MSRPNFWILFGTEEYIYDEPLEGDLDIRTDEKFLAVFTSREKAVEYAEVSKAATFTDITWRSQNKGRQFKKESLLAGSTGYVVYPLDTPTLEIDPKL